MRQMSFNLSCIAIFISELQSKILDSTDNPEILTLFFKKLELLFPNLTIYTNYLFKNQNNIELIQMDSELSFLFAVTDKLPPVSLENKDFDEVFFCYFSGIAPLLSLELTDVLLKRHIKYLAQYSYSENLPKGIVPYFLSREFVNSLPDKLPSTAHDYLIKNLNHYDTEIFFQEPDLRQFRLDFSISDYRSLKMTEFFLKINPELEYKDLLSTLLNNPNGFRLSPSYVEIEIFRGCESNCTFCPRQFISNEKDGNKISLEFLHKFLDDLKQTFPFPVTICLGGMGEPFLHPEINAIINSIVNYPFLSELIIETGLYLDINNFLESLKHLGEKSKKVSFIVNLTTLKEIKYNEIYKNESSVKSVLDRIESIKDLLGKESVHVQMIKMKEVEEEIDEYFTYFENLGINVILQKYNSYANLMPEKRVSDLTPIKRDFCWHLTRDLYINADGSVNICRQNLQTSIGNLNSESVFEIWQKGMANFSYSLSGNHEKVNAPCLNCDEWYTFNA